MVNKWFTTTTIRTRIIVVITTALVLSLVGSSGNIIIADKGYAQLTISPRTSSPFSSSPPSNTPNSPLNSVVLPSTSSPSMLSSSVSSPSSSIIPPSLIPAISALWARWVLQIPAPLNPILDSTGAHCGQNQLSNGNFWFLVGDFGGVVTRQCTIPHGKFIFFPVANAIVTDFPKPPGNIQQEQTLAKQLADSFLVSSLRASVDNLQLSNTDIKRAQSVPFPFLAPPNEILGDPAGFGTGVTDGYWVILNPLPVGQHTIHFSAQTNTSPPFKLDVTYKITVQ
jgi:hypothetical protein